MYTHAYASNEHILTVFYHSFNDNRRYLFAAMARKRSCCYSVDCSYHINTILRSFGKTAKRYIYI